MTPTRIPRCTIAPAGRAAASAARHRAALPRLGTRRLTLRAPETRDFPLWAEIFAAPDSGSIGGPLDGEAAWCSFCGYVACWLLHGHGPWTIERSETGRAIGFVHVGLEWDDEEPELGWFLAASARGRGFATEAASAARDHALALLGPGRVVSYIDPANAPSRRLAARLGATRDPAAEAAMHPAIQDGCEIWRHGAAA